MYIFNKEGVVYRAANNKVARMNYSVCICIYPMLVVVVFFYGFSYSVAKTQLMIYYLEIQQHPQNKLQDGCIFVALDPLLLTTGLH